MKIPKVVYTKTGIHVASFAEAWIENRVRLRDTSGDEEVSPPSRRRGLKTVADTVSNDGDFSRLLRGGVD